MTNSHNPLFEQQLSTWYTQLSAPSETAFRLLALNLVFKSSFNLPIDVTLSYDLAEDFAGAFLSQYGSQLWPSSNGPEHPSVVQARRGNLVRYFRYLIQLPATRPEDDVGESLQSQRAARALARGEEDQWPRVVSTDGRLQGREEESKFILPAGTSSPGPTQAPATAASEPASAPPAPTTAAATAPASQTANRIQGFRTRSPAAFPNATTKTCPGAGPGSAPEEVGAPTPLNMGAMADALPQGSANAELVQAPGPGNAAPPQADEARATTDVEPDDAEDFDDSEAALAPPSPIRAIEIPSRSIDVDNMREVGPGLVCTFPVGNGEEREPPPECKVYCEMRKDMRVHHQDAHGFSG